MSKHRHPEGMTPPGCTPCWRDKVANLERQLAEAQGHVTRLEIALEASVEDLEGAEAQSRLRGEALKAMLEAAPQSIDTTAGHDLFMANKLARAAIDITPEEAREKAT